MSRRPLAVAVPDDRLPASLRTPLTYDVDLVLDTTRARRELGYAERLSADEALARTVSWERAHASPAQPVDFAAEDRVPHDVPAVNVGEHGPERLA